MPFGVGNEGKVQKKNQDPPINLEVIDNYGPWMLSLSRVHPHQCSEYHGGRSGREIWERQEQ